MLQGVGSRAGGRFLGVLDHDPKQTSLGQEERREPRGSVQSLPLELQAFGQVAKLSGYARPGSLVPYTPSSMVPRGLLSISWKQKPVVVVC